MHTFQSYPMDLLDMNPFTKIGKEWALVSAGNKNKCNTMTVSWGGVGVLHKRIFGQRRILLPLLPRRAVPRSFKLLWQRKRTKW